MKLTYTFLYLQPLVGILAMLDEECLRPGTVTDMTFLDKLNTACSEHPHFESRGCRKNISDKTLDMNMFRLVHYAGNVSLVINPFTPTGRFSVIQNNEWKSPV